VLINNLKDWHYRAGGIVMPFLLKVLKKHTSELFLCSATHVIKPPQPPIGEKRGRDQKRDTEKEEMSEEESKTSNF
jgi:hypothetical protein